jgi:hypothetical protein
MTSLLGEVVDVTPSMKEDLIYISLKLSKLEGNCLEL